MSPWTDKDSARLSKLTALFDSPIEAERYAALDAANRLLEAHGTKWRGLAVSAAPVAVRPDVRARSRTWRAEPCDCEPCSREAAEIVLRHPGFPGLSEKQQEFIRSISTKWGSRELTEKQRAYVFGIAEKLSVPRKRRDAA